MGDTWEKKVAIKYYDKLFKEYCLADLSRHKVLLSGCVYARSLFDARAQENKIGMRWRTQKEVFSGITQHPAALSATLSRANICVCTYTYSNHVIAMISGKGQFSCGNIACDVREDLSSYEVLPLPPSIRTPQPGVLLNLSCTV